jgi:hypothetical protein
MIVHQVSFDFLFRQGEFCRQGKDRFTNSFLNGFLSGRVNGQDILKF